MVSRTPRAQFTVLAWVMILFSHSLCAWQRAQLTVAALHCTLNVMSHKCELEFFTLSRLDSVDTDCVKWYATRVCIVQDSQGMCVCVSQAGVRRHQT